MVYYIVWKNIPFSSVSHSLLTSSATESLIIIYGKAENINPQVCQTIVTKHEPKSTHNYTFWFSK